MKILRSIHLYAGCVFAPMICLFALTGLVQLFWRLAGHPESGYFLQLLSTLHTGSSLKTQHGVATLSSGMIQGFACIMALSLVLNVLLGVVMAYKFGHGRKATCCLVAGVVLPLLIVGVQLLRA